MYNAPGPEFANLETRPIVDRSVVVTVGRMVLLSFDRVYVQAAAGAPTQSSALIRREIYRRSRRKTSRSPPQDQPRLRVGRCRDRRPGVARSHECRARRTRQTSDQSGDPQILGADLSPRDARPPAPAKRGHRGAVDARVGGRHRPLRFRKHVSGARPRSALQPARCGALERFGASTAREQSGYLSFANPGGGSRSCDSDSAGGRQDGTGPPRGRAFDGPQG